MCAQLRPERGSAGLRMIVRAIALGNGACPPEAVEVPRYGGGHRRRVIYNSGEWAIAICFDPALKRCQETRRDRRRGVIPMETTIADHAVSAPTKPLAAHPWRSGLHYAVLPRRRAYVSGANLSRRRRALPWLPSIPPTEEFLSRPYDPPPSFLGVRPRLQSAGYSLDSAPR